MHEVFTVESAEKMKKLGKLLARELSGGKIICLTGELGSGKTTFTQGLLRGLDVHGPHTSPTFVIMKEYNKNIYHVDAYRVNEKDILNLGWEEVISDKNNLIIIEWADRIKKIIPKNALWIKFEWVDENKRKIILKSKQT